MDLIFNEYQSSIEELNLHAYPQEIQDQFYDFVTNVPFIRYMVSVDRPKAKDLPRDSEGKIIFDVTKPPILEDMDYFRQAAIYYNQHGCYTNLRPNANPNSEYGKWVKEELRRCWHGMVRPSDGMWITGDMYFMLNYFPMLQTRLKGNSKKGERVIDFPEVWEGINMRFQYIEQAIHGGIFNKEGGRNGCEISSRGKAHPYSQIVYTPDGCKSWGEVQIGDKLFGDDGKLTTVVDIPFDDYTDVYKLTLKDGRVVYASGNHLWNVWRSYSHGYKTMSTLEMMKDFARSRCKNYKNPNGIEYIYRIPKHKGVDFTSQQVPIDAYTFGLLLGDGSFRTPKLKNSFYYTSSDEDILTYKAIVPYPIRKLKNKMQYYIDFPNAKGVLEQLHLHMAKSEDKFIPDCYLFNSRQVRLNVLKGLMDSDGFVDSNGIPIIGVASKRLADNIAFLARSLGYNCTQSIKQSGYKKDGSYIKCLDSYIVRIYTNDRIFNLQRKLDKLTTFESNYSRSNRDFSTIVNIEYSHKEKCKCVTVDNQSHCYLIGDFVTTHNSKSYSMASMMSKRFVIGESEEVNEKVKCMVTAYQKQYLTSDGILNKFSAGIDFLAQNTQWPAKRLKDSMQDMQWIMGYKDLDTGTKKGTQNEVIGVSAKDDISKVRGKRQNLIVVEEFGSFPNVLTLYNVMLPSVQEGDISFGSLYLIGTAGDDESDFQGAAELVYNPEGYRMYALPNVFDLEGQGRKEITFFFPGYLNRKGCYDKDGNSDVTKALLEILVDRYRIKYNSTDINSITKAIAEIPITPQEAILRTRGNLFPVTALNERLNELDNNSDIKNTTYVGMLAMNSQGKVEFKPTADTPIRDFPLKDNKAKGAIEIFEMPQTDRNGNIPSNRYILGHDPVDDDSSGTLSLTSTFVLDLFTDRIVAEYTGRQDYANDNFEIVRLLCLFYNGKCLYEQNKKGLFSYFSQMNCLHLLADTPEYLKDKQIIKEIGWGNKSKGVVASLSVNNYANELIKEWLIKPVTQQNDEGETVTIPNLALIKNRALLKELILYNPDINVDRIRALGMAMLYREEKMIIYQGDIKQTNKPVQKEDDYFIKNYDNRFSKTY